MPKSRKISTKDFYLGGVSQGCSAGFEEKEGDVPGWGLSIRGGFEAATTNDCAAQCKAEAECCSYEWSPTEKKCNLNKECLPTASKYKDYHFCALKGKWQTFSKISTKCFI